MIFDVKMEYLHCKDMMVAEEHVTNPPSTITYASVVLRKTVIIALWLSYLNDLPVKVADIQNDYIMEPVVEKIQTILGREFGGDAGRKTIVVHALYGLKSDGY